MVNQHIGQEAVSEESCGLGFAKKQLRKHGWTEGKGLGKNESGRASAIKVGVKNNTLGVGFDVGQEFTNNWWDHLFNKAASNIVVEESKSGVQVSKKDKENDTKPKRVKEKDLYYGRFVRAKNDDSVTPKSENSEQPTKFSDEELLKACGGRTAHKSARHGHKLNGKLKRVMEQEDQPHPSEEPHVESSKRSKESISCKISKHIDDETDYVGVQNEEIKEPLGNGSIQSKRSSKKQKHNTEENTEENLSTIDSIECSVGEGTYVKGKKRKKKAKKLAKKLKYDKDCELENEEGHTLDRQDETCISEFRDISDGYKSISVKETNFDKNKVRRKRTKNKKKKAEKGSVSEP